VATIHGELAAGRQEIVLMAGGTVVEDVAMAAKRLQTLTPLFSRSDPPGALVVPATWPAVVQLATEFGADWRPGPRLTAWITDQVQRRTELPRLTYEPPPGLVARAYQRDGAALIAATGQALITDEPGTGKTITAILGLVEWWGCAPAWRALPTVVVCPASVVDHWVDCFRAWAPHLRARAWRGTPKQRAALAGTADVYVASYGTATRDAPAGGSRASKAALLQLEAAAVVVDECHLIKSPTSQRSLAVRRLARKAHAVVALSGTPITHNPGDLWATLDALCHDAWPSKERWVGRYCRTVPGEDYGETILGLHPHTEAEFRTAMLGQHRRVAKADVLDQLPDKVYSVRTVQMPAEWRKVYDDFESRMLAELPDGEELSVMDVLAKLTHLSSLSSSPADVRIEIGTKVDKQTGEEIEVEHVHLDLKPTSWKVDALLEVLDERPTESVVVFATRRDLVLMAGAAATKAGRRVGYIIGGQSAAERTAAVNAFQARELDVLCATTQAGGVGLTLTAARTAVFLQRPWSLVDALQAEDRIHRIGAEQHDSVEIVDIVASNTLDTRVRSVLREKGKQLADLVQDPRIVADLLGGSAVSRAASSRSAA
jgi:SNF2 family DNA or RNA helicase